MSSLVIYRAHQTLYATPIATSNFVYVDTGTAISCTAFTAGPGGATGPAGGRTNVVTGPSVAYVPTATNPSQGVTREAAMISAMIRLADQLVALLPAGTSLSQYSPICGGLPTGAGAGPIAP